MPIKISIDVAGGDYGAPVTVVAGLKALNAFEDLQLVFVGDKTTIEQQLAQHSAAQKLAKRWSITHASEVVEMDDRPAIALRKKKDSSMRVAIDLVKNGSVDACVSAGNTGALMAVSRFVLKTITGINRPAIMGRIPTTTGHTHMLDLGANIDSKPEILLEFATMGSISVQYTENIAAPSVGLLNVGEEEIKGNAHVKKTAALLRNSNLNYVGFIEGDDIFKGSVDLVVCDGFEGNIALKASEGVAKMMGHYLTKAFTRTPLTKLVALIASPILRSFKSSLDPGKYNGATLLGLKGIVIKSHGSANVNSFYQAIKEAHLEAQVKIVAKISKQVAIELTSQSKSINE